MAGWGIPTVPGKRGCLATLNGEGCPYRACTAVCNGAWQAVARLWHGIGSGRGMARTVNALVGWMERNSAVLLIAVSILAVFALARWCPLP